jgi:4-hydroxy-3-polyprenylbenzoate decarboxylase
VPFNDLRQYIEKLEAEGELVRIKQEVDWNLEAGAILRRSVEQRAPLPLFEKLRGYPEGYRVFGDPMNSAKRFAIATDQPSDLPYSQMYRRLMEVYDRGLAHKIKPRIVPTGPCKENIDTGDDVNLYKFPSLMLHDGDGGRYIGSSQVIITKDPDTGWVNWGTYRQMIHNKNHLGGFAGPPRDFSYMRRKQEEQNKPMEFAAAMGADPVVMAVSMSPIPFQVDEADVAGGIRGEPVDLVKCETVDLMVPATAEIVVEGHVLPGIRVDEGPCGEYTGYEGLREPGLVYRISCITHRNDPVLPAVCEGIPITTGHLVISISRAAILLADLKRAGLPVVDVNVVPETANFLTVISTKTPYANIAHRIASVVWGSRAAQTGSHKVMVVNDDIDAYNMDEVIHAFATKCHPVRGHFAVPNAAGNPLMPYQDAEERHWVKGSLILYDCTWPVDWSIETSVPPRNSFNNIYPQHIQDKVLANWKNYGFKE